MALHIPIPEGLEDATVQNLEKAAREAVGAQLYREEKLSHEQLAKFLAIGRGEVDEVLGRHGVVDEFSAQEIAEQGKASRDTQCKLRPVFRRSG